MPGDTINEAGRLRYATGPPPYLRIISRGDIDSSQQTVRLAIRSRREIDGTCIAASAAVAGGQGPQAAILHE